jgi:hypothetical protein
MVNPSAFAVFRLITRLNVVGRSTGISPGNAYRTRDSDAPGQEGFGREARV